MAITRAQQYRQMLKDGNFVKQGGVRNYLGKQKTVSDVPLKWQSGSDKPSTELAYITKAEKDLLLKKDIHGSLKDGPNKGPEGIMSLDSAGDKDGPVGGYSGADVSAAESGNTPSGMSPSDAAGFRAGALSAGAGPKDTDTDAIRKEAEEIKAASKARAAAAKAAITKEEKKEARINYKKIQDRLKKDRLKRQTRIEDILSGKIKNFGLTEKELADLKAAGLYDEEEGFTDPELTASSLYGGLPESVASLFEKSDKFSGAEMEAFKEKFNMPDLPGVLGLGLQLFKDPLKKGSRFTKDFFTDDVLSAGKFKYKGKTVTPDMFKFLSPGEMDEVYGGYMSGRQSGEIDAYGNPTNLNTGGGGGGGNNYVPPIIPEDDTEEEDATPSRNLGGLAPRFAGSIFDFTGLANGGIARAGAMDGGRMMMMANQEEDDPEGGIMDLETGRQQYFLGKLVKKAVKAVKKVAKSPIGKAALLYAGGTYLGGLSSLGGSGTFMSNLKSGKGIANLLNFGKTKLGFDSIMKGGAKQTTKGLFSSPFGLITAGSLLAGAMTPKEEEENNNDYYAKYGFGGQKGVDAIRYNKPLSTQMPVASGSIFAADGGIMRNGYAEGSEEPVAKKTMPLLDMDGQEMDLREEGGFVPLGRMERADDVPARLSKNEFVFTADAVRSAGEGDIDKGAEVMYNMMKNLESGGEVSEESQGLEGARKMFQTSQRLEEVI